RRVSTMPIRKLELAKCVNVDYLLLAGRFCPCFRWKAGSVSRVSFPRLLREISTCRVCATHLQHGPRPILRVSSTARLLIISQAPGSKVHQTGIPWHDASG